MGRYTVYVHSALFLSKSVYINPVTCRSQKSRSSLKPKNRLFAFSQKIGFFLLFRLFTSSCNMNFICRFTFLFPSSILLLFFLSFYDCFKCFQLLLFPFQHLNTGTNQSGAYMGGQDGINGTFAIHPAFPQTAA